MNKDDAIRLATEEAVRLGCGIMQDPPTAIFIERHMRLGKKLSGWLVLFRLDVPEGFEPNVLHVEVYEPDGEVIVPLNL